MTEEKQDKGRLRSLLGAVGKRIANLDAGVAEVKMLHSYMIELESIIHTFADTAHEGIVLVQGNKYIWVNRAACDISGYTEEEIFNLNMELSMLPDDRDKLRARVDMLLAGDMADLPLEWRILRKDRTVRYVNAFAYRVKFIDKPAILVLFYDMTESKKIHDELMMKAQVLDAVSDGVFLADSSGKIIYVNDAVSARTGYTKEELLNMDIRKLSPPERASNFDIRLKQFSEHKVARFNTVALLKNGNKLAIEVRGNIIRQGGKQFLLAVTREMPNSDTENAPDNVTKKGH